MPKRLLLILALLLLALPGCVGKNTGSAELPPDDYTLTLPENWKFVPASKIPAKAKRSLVKGDLQLIGAYTAAPASEFRLPFIVFSRKDSGKMSRSEMLMVRDNIEQIFASSSDADSAIRVNSKSFDEEAHRLIADATVTAKNNMSLSALASFHFSEKGMVVAFGYAAQSDTRSQAEIRKIMESVVLSPELQYRPDRHEIITAQKNASVVWN